ncbi:MAG: response regulator [bacterium]|nr:response regulator [bacterium]
MRILVVEDDFISRRLLCRYLEPFGDCDVAVNGEEAVDAVKYSVDQGEQYDLICLDIMMPGMNGHETLKLIRDYEEKNDLQLGDGAKIIMTTSLEDHRSIREAFKASADGYVVKPVEKKKFLSTLSEIGITFEVPL